jgi:GT2 family glycosyltransferase
MTRPAVDIVVPFRGSQSRLDDLRARLGRIRLRPGDSVVIVDNTPGQERLPGRAVERLERGAGAAASVLVGPGTRVPARARNRGAACGSAGWILFLDDDVIPSVDLLDSYFEPEPDDRVALLAGGIRDEPVPPDGPATARYNYLRKATSQDDTLRFGKWGFPKTANLAVRRAAFDAAGGFTDTIRAGEDSDLTYRLTAGGWTMERREHASVVHHNRQTVTAFMEQKVVHGSGGGWLERRYPGSFPPRRRVALVWWAARTQAAGLIRLLRSGDRDTALWELFEPIEALFYEFGRSWPNERPLTIAVWLRALRQSRRGPTGSGDRE